MEDDRFQRTFTTGVRFIHRGKISPVQDRAAALEQRHYVSCVKTMDKNKRGFLLAAATMLASLSVSALSSSIRPRWLAKPVQWIVPDAAGTFADLLARQLGQMLARSLGTSVMVENRPGAGGMTGIDALANALPDGHVIGMSSLSALALQAGLMKRLPHDPLRRLQPVILLELAPLFLPDYPASGIDGAAGSITLPTGLTLVSGAAAQGELKGFQSHDWLGVLAPAGTPAFVVECLNRELNLALNTAAVRHTLAEHGAQPAGGTAAQFGDFIKNETVVWGKLVQAAACARQALA
jgi:tripartite-type tricarboxylate transporter receptor subunit TctC